VAAALCAHAPSLTAAQQRAVLVLAVPPLLVLGVGWLLPGLPSLGYFSLPHVVVSALSFRPGFTGAWGGMAALAAYSLVGAGALALARWQLRRWPPA